MAGYKKFSASDYGLLASALGAIYADIATTKDLLRKGGKETNPLLGENPSNKKLNAAGLLMGGLVTGAAMNLPYDLRHPFLGAVAGFEAAIARQNSQIKQTDDPMSFKEAITEPLAFGMMGAMIGRAISGVSMKPEKGGASLTFTKRF